MSLPSLLFLLTGVAVAQNQAALRGDTAHHPHGHHHHHQHDGQLAATVQAGAAAAAPAAGHKVLAPVNIKVGCDRPMSATNIGYEVVPNPPVAGEKLVMTGHGVLPKQLTAGNWTLQITLAGGVSIKGEPG